MAQRYVRMPAGEGPPAMLPNGRANGYGDIPAWGAPAAAGMGMDAAGMAARYALPGAAVLGAALWPNQTDVQADQGPMGPPGMQINVPHRSEFPDNASANLSLNPRQAKPGSTRTVKEQVGDDGAITRTVTMSSQVYKPSPDLQSRLNSINSQSPTGPEGQAGMGAPPAPMPQQMPPPGFDARMTEMNAMRAGGGGMPGMQPPPQMGAGINPRVYKAIRPILPGGQFAAPSPQEQAVVEEATQMAAPMRIKTMEDLRKLYKKIGAPE